jgi:putative nucleotidyltransferase with HDIG domain
MEMHQLSELKRWFDKYTMGFFGSDEFVNFHIHLKREHTQRTCEEILNLARHLSLDDNQKRLAETIALLHDIGRFPQFAAHRTYNDSKSVNHCTLGIEVLRREGALKSLDERERFWVETAIEYHGGKSLPENINEEALLFLKLIRDADKLDIFQIVIRTYRKLEEDPGGILLELPNEPQISREVLEAVLAGQLVGYEKLKTLNDFKLCQIGWVYDLNFSASLEKLESGNLLNELFNFLPQTPEIAEVRRKIHSYIAPRLK